jgi:hypothetical protein
MMPLPESRRVSGELPRNSIKAKFAECTSCAARDIREAFLLLPADDWFAGGLAQSYSLEAYFCSTSAQHSTEIQFREFCVFGLEQMTWAAANAASRYKNGG